MKEKPHILMDDARGGYLVTRYLTELGHRNIMGFFKADDMQGLERHKGYVKALQEAEISYDPDNVVWFHTEDRKVKPALIAREMLEKGNLPDGIVCYNDQIAVQVMEELEKAGIRIPDDISVTGYDNSLYARRGTGITTIAHPQEKLGEMAAELIMEKINGVAEKDSKVERLIEPELIIRGSCVVNKKAKTICNYSAFYEVTHCGTVTINKSIKNPGRNIIMKTGRNYKFWFCTGSQDLYGDECLAKSSRAFQNYCRRIESDQAVLPYRSCMETNSDHK